MTLGVTSALLAGCSGIGKYSSSDNLITEQTVQITAKNPKSSLDVSRRAKGAQGVDADRPFMGVAIGANRTIAGNGQDVLLQGGNAIDAVVAMSFMQAVTRPHVAGLGSQGACLVHNSKVGLTEVLDFAPKNSLVPTMPRGLAILHSRYGEMAWGDLILSAEKQARRGVPVTSAMAVAAKGKTFEGQNVDTGDIFYRDRLSLTLSLLRLQGGGALYTGKGINLLLEDAKRLGVSLNVNTVRHYQPKWRGAIPVKTESGKVYLLGRPTSLGTPTAQTLSILKPALNDDWKSVNREQVVSNALQRVQNTPLKNGLNVKDTSVMAVDDTGLAVICQTSLNGDFGFGGTSPKLGMTFPRPSKSFEYLPVIGVDEQSRFKFMMAVDGQSVTLSETVTSIADAMYAKDTFFAVTNAPRAWTNGKTWYAETAYETDATYQRKTSKTIVNGVLCPSALPADGQEIACSAAVDPRGTARVGFAGFDSVSQGER